MNTYVNVKTQKRFPVQGYAASFEFKPGKPAKMFVRGKGWFTIKAAEWIGEAIEDLPKDWTYEQFRAHAAKYGVECTQEFLHCCDYSKLWSAAAILHPDPGAPTDAEDLAFKTIFGQSVLIFQDRMIGAFCNRFSFDVIRFEEFMARHFGYPKNEDGSLSDFIKAKFGESAEALIRQLLNRKTA
jgi:hypothetical protein